MFTSAKHFKNLWVKKVLSELILYLFRKKIFAEWRMGIMIIRELNCLTNCGLPALQESGNNMSSLQGRRGGWLMCGTAHRASLLGQRLPELYTHPLLFCSHKTCVSRVPAHFQTLVTLQSLQDGWVFSCCLGQAAFALWKSWHHPAFSPTDSPAVPSTPAERVYSGSLGNSFCTVFLSLFLPGVACSWPSLLSKSHSLFQAHPMPLHLRPFSNLWPQRADCVFLPLEASSGVCTSGGPCIVMAKGMGSNAVLSYLPAM